MDTMHQNLDGANNDQFINMLFAAINAGPVTIFLGAGSSLESIDKKGKPLLSFSEMQNNIVATYGNTEQKRKMSNGNSSQKWETFLSVIRDLAEDDLLDSVLEEHLEGLPSYAHHILAAFSIAQKKLHLTLTSNYDHIFSNAMGKIASTDNKPFRTYSIRESMGDELRDMINSSENYPVIIKLFGDLGHRDGVFEPMELKRIINTNHHAFKDVLERPIIFIGYSFSDDLYHSLLGEKGKTVYIVNPTPIHGLKTTRKYLCFKGTFNEFMFSILERFKKEDRCKKERGPDREKWIIAQEIQRLLQNIKPTAKYKKPEDMLETLNTISQRNIDLLENRFQIHNKKEAHANILIDRNGVSRWVDDFLSSPKNYMLLLGESGLGKSCFLYTLAKKQLGNVICSLFSGVTLSSEKGFFGEISQEFCIAEHDIKDFFIHIDELLKQSVNYRKWLVVLDGINESTHFHIIMGQITKLSSWNLNNIKLLYSCRTIFWEMENASRRYGHLESSHYSGWSCHIKYFSLEEAEEAYGKYQAALNISSAWSEINHQVREYMCNPLMMRMIVLAYQGSALMEYIPATAVFEKYLNFLKEKVKPTDAQKNPRMLITLARHKTSNVENKFINKDDLFFIDSFRQQGIAEIDVDLWQDEGVLVWIDKDRAGSFRFSFDRFYEYMLAESMLGEHTTSQSFNLVSWALKKYDQLDLVQAHFSYREAVKSVLVYCGIKNNSIQVDELINAVQNQKYSYFAKQCLRELLFETSLPIIESFDKIITATTDKAERIVYAEVQISLATNSPKVIDVALPGIFSGDDLLSHRCIRILHSIGSTYRFKIAEKVADIFTNLATPKESHYKGMLYLYILYFTWGNNAKERELLLYEAVSSYLPKLMLFPDYKHKIASALRSLIKQWGPYLFSTSSRNGANPFNYPWDTMGPEEREYALIVNQALAKNFDDIDHRDRQAIYFFSLELPRVSQINQNIPVSVVTEFPFESKISQWVLIRHGKERLAKIINILDEFVKQNHFCTSDFSICLLYDVLLYNFNPKDPEFFSGYETLKSWVNYFWENNDDFFGALNSEDPYNDTYNPLEETGYVCAKIFPNNPTNIFIDEWVCSDDIRRKKLGLLAVRRMWQQSGMQVLRSAKSLFQEKETQIYTWLNRLMKEISLIDRRTYDRYISELELPIARCQEIERTHSHAIHAENYSAAALLEFFCNNGLDKIGTLQHWHREIYQSNSLDDFLDKLAQHLVFFQHEICLRALTKIFKPHH